MELGCCGLILANGVSGEIDALNILIGNNGAATDEV